MSSSMKSDPLAAHRKVESLTGEGFLRRELALALRVSSREEETRRKKKDGQSRGRSHGFAPSSTFCLPPSSRDG